MSLLSDVRSSLENRSTLLLVGIDYRDDSGSFNTVVFRVAPTAKLPRGELRPIFWSLRTWIPEETYKMDDHFENFNPYGVLTYKEVIGKERVIRTFSVDDAVHYSGQEFGEGPQVPEEHELFRTIEVRFYPTPEEARRRKSGQTVYEAPTGVVY